MPGKPAVPAKVTWSAALPQYRPWEYRTPMEEVRQALHDALTRRTGHLLAPHPTGWDYTDAWAGDDDDGR